MIEHFITTDPTQIRMIETFLDNGLMKTNISAGFLVNMDMNKRLNDMEEHLKGLKNKCPEEMRHCYAYSKTQQLVKILHKHVHPAFRPDFNALMKAHKEVLWQKGIAIPSTINIDAYTDEYLPEYTEVRQTLLQTFHQLRPNHTTSDVLPLMITATDGSGFDPTEQDS